MEFSPLRSYTQGQPLVLQPRGLSLLERAVSIEAQRFFLTIANRPTELFGYNPPRLAAELCAQLAPSFTTTTPNIGVKIAAVTEFQDLRSFAHSFGLYAAGNSRLWSMSDPRRVFTFCLEQEMHRLSNCYGLINPEKSKSLLSHELVTRVLAALTLPDLAIRLPDLVRCGNLDVKTELGESVVIALPACIGGDLIFSHLPGCPREILMTDLATRENIKQQLQVQDRRSTFLRSPWIQAPAIRIGVDEWHLNYTLPLREDNLDIKNPPRAFIREGILESIIPSRNAPRNACHSPEHWTREDRARVITICRTETSLYIPPDPQEPISDYWKRWVDGFIDHLASPSQSEPESKESPAVTLRLLFGELRPTVAQILKNTPSESELTDSVTEIFRKLARHTKALTRLPVAVRAKIFGSICWLEDFHAMVEAADHYQPKEDRLGTDSIASWKDLVARVSFMKSALLPATLDPRIAPILQAPNFDYVALARLSKKPWFKELCAGRLDRYQPFQSRSHLYTGEDLSTILNRKLNFGSEHGRKAAGGRRISPITKRLFGEVSAIASVFNATNGTSLKVRDLFNAVPQALVVPICLVLEKMDIAYGGIYRAEIHAKSDPRGWVAGNWTSSCNKFGSAWMNDTLRCRYQQLFTVQYRENVASPENIIAHAVIFKGAVSKRTTEIPLAKPVFTDIILDNVEAPGQIVHQAHRLTSIIEDFWLQADSSQSVFMGGQTSAVGRPYWEIVCDSVVQAKKMYASNACSKVIFKICRPSQDTPPQATRFSYTRATKRHAPIIYQLEGELRGKDALYSLKELRTLLGRFPEGESEDVVASTIVSSTNGVEGVLLAGVILDPRPGESRAVQILDIILRDPSDEKKTFVKDDILAALLYRTATGAGVLDYKLIIDRTSFERIGVPYRVFADIIQRAGFRLAPRGMYSDFAADSVTERLIFEPSL
jgi:hypothetical protein